jgi:hypothetical protein
MQDRNHYFLLSKGIQPREKNPVGMGSKTTTLSLLHNLNLLVALLNLEAQFLRLLFVVFTLVCLLVTQISSLVI